jgi:hypothetical protein
MSKFYTGNESTIWLAILSCLENGRTARQEAVVFKDWAKKLTERPSTNILLFLLEEILYQKN